MKVQLQTNYATNYGLRSNIAQNTEVSKINFGIHLRLNLSEDVVTRLNHITEDGTTDLHGLIGAINAWYKAAKEKLAVITCSDIAEKLNIIFIEKSGTPNIHFSLSREHSFDHKKYLTSEFSVKSSPDEEKKFKFDPESIVNAHNTLDQNIRLAVADYDDLQELLLANGKTEETYGQPLLIAVGE